MSLLDVLIAPGALVGTVVGAMVAVGIGRFFPEHDLTLLQMFAVVAGFLVGLVLDLAGGPKVKK